MHKAGHSSEGRTGQHDRDHINKHKQTQKTLDVSEGTLNKCSRHERFLREGGGGRYRVESLPTFSSEFGLMKLASVNEHTHIHTNIHAYTDRHMCVCVCGWAESRSLQISEMERDEQLAIDDMPVSVL